MITSIENITNEEAASISDHTFLDTVEAYKYKVPGCDPIDERAKAFNSFLEKAVYGPLKFRAICVRGSDTPHARRYLIEAKSRIILAVTTGFPDGRVKKNQKIYETKAALENGAEEVDFVINGQMLKNKDVHYVKAEMTELAYIISEASAKSKAIFETSKLTSEEIVLGCKIAEDTGIDFVKTGTGYSGPATPEAVRIMRQNFSRGVKAAGGVNQKNLKLFLYALSGRTDGKIDLNPDRIRIGEGSLFAGIWEY